MAQENHEIVPYDPANFPTRRKRGRPRKYDYPGYEPRRRAQTHYPRLNLTQPSPNPSGQAVQPQPNPPPSSSHVRRGSAAQTAATPTSFSHGPPHIQVRASNATANSGHGPDRLLGKTVSGVLDGIFESGYLLTVRVGATGPVLKGLVFDPHVSVPLSADNDVAPLLPMTKRSEIPIPGQAPISVPIQTVPNRITVARPIQIREPGCELPPPSSRKRATKHDGKFVSPDMQFALRSELRAKILRALLNKAASDANAQSTSAAPSKSRKRFKQDELLSGSSAGKIEMSEVIADASVGDQNCYVVENPRECEGSKQIEGGPSGLMQQVATKPSGSDGSSDQMELLNSQTLVLSKNKGLSGDVVGPNILLNEQPNAQTSGLNSGKESLGQIQEARTPISGSSGTEQLPDQRQQPDTEPSSLNEIKESSGKMQDPITAASGLNGTEGFSSGENNLPTTQSSEQVLPPEEPGEEPGENEHLDPVAAQAPELHAKPEI